MADVIDLAGGLTPAVAGVDGMQWGNRRPRWRALMACEGITPCNAEGLLAPGRNGLYMDSVESIF